MKKSKMILAAAAVALPLSIAGGNALAYFTANTSATGGCAVEVGMDTDIKETFSQWTKHIKIENKGGGAVYVRAKAFSGEQYELTYPVTEGWERRDDDGYWYYSSILEPGTEEKPITTSELQVKISGAPDNKEDKKEEFNVIVIYEQMPVKYDENGNPIKPTAEDWKKYAVKTEEKNKLTGTGIGGGN